MPNSTVRNGWSIRRPDRCYGSENGHNTWDEMWTCCPPNTEEQVDEDNNTRCYLNDSDADTSESASAFPDQCANSTLVLWSNGGNYFCCEEELFGFVNEHDYEGCATKPEIEKNDTMTIVDQHGRPDVTTNSSSTETSTTTPTSSASSESSTNKGAIAGGVVGGVGGALIIAGMIWFFLRRRKRRPASTPQLWVQPGANITQQGYKGYQPAELDGGIAHKELPGNSQPRYELPSS